MCSQLYSLLGKHTYELVLDCDALVVHPGTGAIPAVDVARYKEMGAAINCLFSSRVGSGGPQASGTNMTWTFDTPITSTNMSIWVLEDQSDGQLINQWSLDCRVGDGGWIPCHDNDVSIGHKRIINVILAPPSSTSMDAIRLNIHSHFALPDQVPKIARLEVYDWGSKTACV